MMFQVFGGSVSSDCDLKLLLLLLLFILTDAYPDLEIKYKAIKHEDQSHQKVCMLVSVRSLDRKLLLDGPVFTKNYI